MSKKTKIIQAAISLAVSTVVLGTLSSTFANPYLDISLPDVGVEKESQDPPIAQPGMLSSDDIRGMVIVALQRSVSRAEGGWHPGRAEDETYKTLYGGSLFESYEDHPGSIISAGAYDSDAAGAYQFMSDTWDGIWNRYEYWYEGPKFSPQNQDLAMRRLFAETGALATLESGIVVKNQVVSVKREALVKAVGQAASTWCGLPGEDRGLCGGGYIGGKYYPPQPYKDIDTMVEWFNTELNIQQGIK